MEECFRKEQYKRVHKVHEQLKVQWLEEEVLDTVINRCSSLYQISSPFESVIVYNISARISVQIQRPYAEVTK